jgi:hypothetical protein
VWLLCWYVAFSFDSVWVKHVCNTIKMTNWGRAFYNNLLALVPLLFLLPGTCARSPQPAPQAGARLHHECVWSTCSAWRSWVAFRCLYPRHNLAEQEAAQLGLFQLGYHWVCAV